MNKKSRIKSTLDSLFTGGKISPEEKKEPQEEIVQESKPGKKEEDSPKFGNSIQEKNLQPAMEETKPVLPVENNHQDVKTEMTRNERIEKTSVETEKPVTQIGETKPVDRIVEKKKMDVDRVQELAESISRAEFSDGDDEEHLVIFSLGKELYGVAIHSVESIIKLQAITEVPHAASFILGVTNLRGTVVPVLDLRRRFNMACCENTPNTRIVIINAEGSKVGIVVDEVTEVLKVSRNSIQPPPAMSTTVESAFINGIARINNRLVILLDLEKVLASSSRQYNR